MSTLARFCLVALLIGVLSGKLIADSESASADKTEATAEQDEEESQSDQTSESASSTLEEVKVVAHPLSGAGVRAIGNIDVVSIDYNNLDRVRVENLADVIASVPRRA